MVGVIGVALAIVTIAAHHEHTDAVLTRTEANDLWSFYQAKKIREHTSDVGGQLLRALGTDATRTEAAAAKLDAARAKYMADAEAVQKDAKGKEEETGRAEHQAQRFDLCEGFIEHGLLLTSLYYHGRHRAFPVAGGAAAVHGALSAAYPLLG